MALAVHMYEIAEALVTKLETNKVSLGLADVFYGDQEKLPSTPIACVEPDTKTNTLSSAQRKVQIEFQVFILLYHSAVQSPEANRRDSDQLAADIETLIHADRTLLRPDLTDRVIHCMIESVASGYVTKSNTLVRASRLTFSALSQTILPS